MKQFANKLAIAFTLLINAIVILSSCKKEDGDTIQQEKHLSKITTWKYAVDYPSGQLKDTGYITIDLIMDNNKVTKSYQEYINKDGSASSGIDSIRYSYSSENKLSAIYGMENGQDNTMDSLSYNTLGAINLIQHYYPYSNSLYGYTQYNYNSNLVLFNISYYEKRGANDFNSYGSDTITCNSIGDVETIKGDGMGVTFKYLNTANKLSIEYPSFQFIEQNVLGVYNGVPPFYGSYRNYFYQSKLISQISINNSYYNQTYTYDLTYEFDRDGYPLMVRVNGNPYKKFEYK